MTDIVAQQLKVLKPFVSATKYAVIGFLFSVVSKIRLIKLKTESPVPNKIFLTEDLSK